MGRIRNVCSHDLSLFDMPQLPALILLDDIDNVISRLEVSTVDDKSYYTYTVNSYPGSRYEIP